MQASLIKEFNETAAAAHKAFPWQLDKLVILSSSMKTPVYVSPIIADEITNETWKVKKAVRKSKKYIRNHRAAGFAQRNYKLGRNFIALIGLCGEQEGKFSADFTKKMRSIYVLDHELGHHIVPGGFSSIIPESQQRAENCADAYAILRHIQRFGKDTKYSKRYADSKASHIILLGDMAHYTSDAIQRAVQLSQQEDISSFSLKEIANAAREIAWESNIDSETLEKIRDAFEPLRRACKLHAKGARTLRKKIQQEDRETYEFICRQVISVMKRHGNDKDIFTAGRRFLTGTATPKNLMQEKAKTDPYWREALNYINGSRSESAFSQSLESSEKSSRKLIRRIPLPSR